MARASLPAGTARDFYRSLGESAVEFLAICRGEHEPLAHVHLDDPTRARLDELLRNRTPVILATSHTGNWDLTACAVARDYPLTVLTKSLHAEGVDRIWQSTRASFGVDLVRAETGAFTTLRRAAASGRMVAVMIDQAPIDQESAERVPFLGETAFVDRAAGLLAASTNGIVLVIGARRDGRETRVSILEELARCENEATRDFVSRVTHRATLALDAFVRAHPDSWLWLHRRWKTPPKRRATLEAT